MKAEGLGERKYSSQRSLNNLDREDGEGSGAKKSYTKPVGAPIRIKGHLPKNGEITRAEVVMFSGCKDDQESADVEDTVRRNDGS